MSKKLFFTLFNFLILFGSLIGQIKHTKVAEQLTNFGFELFSGGVILVKAKFNHFNDTLNFIFDTGSGGISIDSATAEKMLLKPEPSNIIIKGIAGTRTLSFVKNATLRFPGLVVENLDFHVSDYQILTESYGVKVDGIIGYSFFRRYIVSINFDDSTIRVFSPGKFRYPRSGQLLNPRFTTLPIVTAVSKENNRTISSDFYFDTGAGLCYLASDQFVKDSMLFDSAKKFYNSQVEGLGGKAQMRLTLLKELKLGRYKFKKVPVYVFNDENRVTSYPEQSGLIGNDLLRRFNLVINYPAREIHIKPNSHFKDKFDYSYSGLNIYFIDGKIEVGEVMKGSPAELAGILPGDVIVGIENNFSNNIQRYKEMLQSTDYKLKLILIRHGELLPVTLKTIDIKRGK